MGKSQSKLSNEELAELQKNTYCEPRIHILSQLAVQTLIHDTVDKKELQQWVSFPWASRYRRGD